MAITLNTGTGGANVETVVRSGTDQRVVVEPGYVPTFWALTGALTAGASKFQFVLFNNNASFKVEIRKVVLVYPSSTTVSSVFSGLWTQRFRRAPTTDPAGGTLTIQSMDSADSLPSSISAHSAPTTSPAGGTTHDLHVFLPQPDEIKNSALDAPTQLSGYDFSGLTLWDFNQLGPNAKPPTLRQDQTYEIQQDATAGTILALRLLTFFTVVSV